MHRYENKMEAVRGVLAESCALLNAANVQYVVAGGWVPYLRGEGNALHHPGTRDVDLLFNDEPHPIGLAVTKLMGAGYVPSAKHPFQLLKELAVEDQKVMVNVDLMHPAEAERDPEMFQDIIDLGIKENYDSDATHMMKSICFPSARIVFDEHLWSMVAISAVLPDGNAAQIDVPLMDECGLVLSKCGSVSGIKRDRDSFDIFFALTGPMGNEAAARLAALEGKSAQVQEHVGKLRSFLREHSKQFDKRVAAYSGGADVRGASARVLSIIGR